MKLTAILLLAAALQVSAKGFGQVITLNLKNASLEKAITEIEKQSGFSFVYGKEQLDLAKPINISVNNEKLETVLDKLFKDLALTYTISGKYIAIKQKVKAYTIFSRNESEETSPIDVHGVIVNEKGEPVVGATIVVKETGKVVSANDKGEFTLKGIDNNATLIISGVSIETMEVKVNGRTELGTIIAIIKVSEGKEVVVQVPTGYQKISKERFVGSYSQLDSAAYERRTGMGILDRLDGTVTGVLFDKKTSETSALANMTIRGLSTLNSDKTPLIIVDDFPYPQRLDNINPNDVESITVLKDAAAISIWGARAGNGVIVITTKKGKFNQPLSVTVRSNITIKQKPDLYHYPQMTASDFIEIEELLFNKGFYDANLTNINVRPVISPVVEMLAKRRAGLISAADSATQIDAFRELDLRRDLNKYAYRNPVIQQHYISIGKGSNIINYTLSGGYNRELNTYRNSKANDQISLNSNVGFRPTKNLQISNNIAFTQTTQRSTIFSLPDPIYPYAQLADAEGNPLALAQTRRLAYTDTAGSGNLLDWRYRPLEEPGLADNKTAIQLIQLNFKLAYQFNTWLKAEAAYQYSNQSVEGSSYNSLQTYYTRNLVNLFTNLSQSNPALRNPVPKGGILDISNYNRVNQNVRTKLEINKNFTGGSQIIAMAAADISDVTTSSLYANRFYNYNKETGSYQGSMDYVTFFPTFTGGSTTIPNNNYLGPATYKRFVSFSANASYTYRGRYTIYSSARKDGANVFGVNTNRKWNPLWSIGASWDISKEKFYSIKWMSLLRLRTSYGYAGNPGLATGLPTIYYPPTAATITNLNYAIPQDAPNPDLRWEKVGIINVAVDFSLFNNRLTGSFDIWQKKSTDLISTIPFAPATGIPSFTLNSANLRGRGFEVSLNSKNLIGAFKWDTRVGLSHAKTLITKLHAITTRYQARDFLNYGINAVEGQIAYGVSSFRWAGLDPLTGDPRGIFNKQVSNNYSAILADSVGNQVFHGSSIPLYSGFIWNSFSWKNFTLSANITYRFDFYFRRPTINYDRLINYWGGHADYALRWKKSGDEQFTNVPSFNYPSNPARDFFYQYSEVNVLRGDNIRLQDIRLQYNWRTVNTKKMPLKGIVLFLYANELNLIIWRKNKSKIDPDFIGGTDILSTPQPKSWTCGVNLTF